jgi:hypothetical protein
LSTRITKGPQENARIAEYTGKAVPHEIEKHLKTHGEDDPPRNLK